MTQTSMIVVQKDSPYMEHVYALRYDVFVTEQQVPVELEIDEYDEIATHIAYLRDDEVIGTLRIIDYHGEAKIGRVAVRQDMRGQGIGKEIMNFAVAQAKELEFSRVILEAQIQALDFYVKLGFAGEGDIFMDAGIPHRKMSKEL